MIPRRLQRAFLCVVALAMFATSCGGSAASVVDTAENAAAEAPAPAVIATTPPVDVPEALGEEPADDQPAMVDEHPELEIAAEESVEEAAMADDEPVEEAAAPAPTAVPAPTATAVPATAAPAPTAVPAPTATAVPAAPAALVPQLTGAFPTIGGGQIDLGSLQGQDTVLWFWAPW